MENLSVFFSTDKIGSLKLCAGDFFQVEMDSLKNEYLLKIAQLYDFDAFLPGVQDLYRFDKLLYNKVTLVCANLEKNGEFVFPSVVIKEIEGSRILISGLWSENTFASLPDSMKASWKFQSPKTSFEQSILPQKTDDDILLIITQGPETFAKSLLLEYPEIDIVFNGEGKTANLKPFGNGYLINIDRGSDYLGSIKFALDNKLLKGKSPVVVESYTSIPIYIGIPVPTSSVKSIVDEYYEKWFQALQAERNRFIGVDRVFFGNKFCGKCHQAQYNSWISTSHASAFDALKNLENRCLPCHTTGFGYPTGFWEIDITPSLVGVGCEECHIVKKLPLKSAEQHLLEPVTQENCKCHKPPHDNDFDFERDVLKVKH